jgi:hypothetical protein
MGSMTVMGYRKGSTRFLLTLAAIAGLAAAWPAASNADGTASYSMTQTIPVPPASSYSGSGGGDGWAVAMTPAAVYNVFHHSGQFTVACHKQSDATPCWNPKTIVDDNNGGFATSGQPGLYLDQASAKLYVYATRNADQSGGVVCVDTVKADQDANPFCGFTLLTNAGDAPVSGNGALSAPALVGTHLYAFDYADGSGVDGTTKNTLLCFDTSLRAPCAGQPFALPMTAGTVGDGNFPAPSVAAWAGHVIVPVTVGGMDQLTCFDDATAAPCAGDWPVPLPSRYSSVDGASFPLLGETGAITGFCLPVSSDPCFDFHGDELATPAGLSSVITPTTGWNGPAFVLGTREYVPNGNIDMVQCWDAATGASCVNFPRGFPGLSYLYTVNADPQRPSCVWVNADGGSGQIQNFDAYTAGGCGNGPVRVLASSVVAPTQACLPTSYSSLQVTAPARSSYTNGTITFVDGDDNAIPGVPEKTLDATGSVSLSGLPLNTRNGLPQFLISLDGASATTSVTVKITWTASADPSCTPSGQQASLVYVAVGDSYSSGEGAPPFEDGTNYPYVDQQENTLTYGPGATSCHRSLTNYAKIVAPRLSQMLTPVLVDRTCSGAEIAPSGGSKGPIAPTAATSGRSDGQVDQALSRLAAGGRDAASVQLVSATMGGNDAGFGDLIEACLVPNLARTLFANYDQTPGEVEWFVDRFHCKDVDDHFFHTGDKISKLKQLEEDGQAGLLAAFPNARIDQLTYPGIVPEGDDFPGDSCGGLLSSDAGYVRSKVEAIDDAVRDSVAATRSTNSRMHVVDVQNAFGSNALCPADPSKALANGISQQRLTAVIQSLLAEGTESRRLLDDLNGRYKGFRDCVVTHSIGGILGPLGAAAAEALCKGPLDNLMDAFHNLGDYFTPDRIQELVGDLASGATDEQRFDNSRLFFHPNTTGFDVMACYLEADFKATTTSGCAPKYDGVLAYSVNGVALVHPTPIAVSPGLNLPFFLNGFDLGSLLDVLIHSPVQDLGTFPVGQDGTVSDALKLPADLPAGVHKLTFSGTNSGSPRQVDVLVQVPGLPEPGQDFGFYQPGFAGDTSVTVKYGDLDWGALTPDADGGVYVEVPVPQLQPGESLPITLTGDSGESIHVTVTVATHAGSQPPPATTKPTLSCTVTPIVSVSPATLTAGHSARVTVRAVPGSQVALFAASKHLVATTDAQGAAKLTIKPTANTRLYALVSATGCATSRSTTRTLAVRAAVTLKVRRASARRYVFSGVVRPAGGSVKVYATSHGHTTLIGRAKADKRTGRWRLAHAFAKAPRVTVVAKTPRTKTNAAGASPRRKVG